MNLILIVKFWLELKVNQFQEICLVAQFLTAERQKNFN